jgi:hypothetical protein
VCCLLTKTEIIISGKFAPDLNITFHFSLYVSQFLSEINRTCYFIYLRSIKEEGDKQVVLLVSRQTYDYVTGCNL